MRHLQWRLLRTPMRTCVGRRALQRRVFWHKIQYIILPQARWDACFWAMTRSLILHLGSRRQLIDVDINWWRRLSHLTTGISSCLFHLNVAMQLLQSYLISITVDDQHAFLLRVIALIAFKNRIWNTRSVCVDKTYETYGTMESRMIFDLPKWGSVTVTELFEPVWSEASLWPSTLAGLKSSKFFFGEGWKN